jgi:hypothetical protein
MEIHRRRANPRTLRIPRPHPLLLGFLLLLVYFIPYLVLQSNSSVCVHDNLDSIFVDLVMLARSGALFDYSHTFQEVMNGIPRSSLAPGISINLWFYLLLPPLTAYLTNEFLVRALALVGMYLLLRRHVLQDGRPYLALLVSSCFGLLPFYLVMGATVPGLPLLCFALMNLYKQRSRWYDFIIILSYPLYSAFLMTGLYICIILIAVALIDVLAFKRKNLQFWAGTAAFVLCCGIVEHGLILSYLLPTGFVSHRVEWKPQRVDLLTNLGGALDMLLSSQYHAGTLHTAPIMLALLLALVWKSRTTAETDRLLQISSPWSRLPPPAQKVAVLALSAIFAIVALHFVYQYVLYWFGDRVPLVKTLQWDRFYFLLPALWMVPFYAALEALLSRRHIINYAVVATFSVVQLGLIICSNRYYLDNIRYVTGQESYLQKLTFNNFFDTQLFSGIAHYIGKDKQAYRVVSIGLHPKIALYNGFHTLDGYSPNYPLSYKHQFRKIIAKELAKSKKYQDYFDDWGSRCYVFASELQDIGTNSRYSRAVLRNLELDTETLKGMGGEYVISAVPILNEKQNRLRFERVFVSESSYWRLYLYWVD